MYSGIHCVSASDWLAKTCELKTIPYIEFGVDDNLCEIEYTVIDRVIMEDDMYNLCREQMIAGSVLRVRSEMSDRDVIIPTVLRGTEKDCIQLDPVLSSTIDTSKLFDSVFTEEEKLIFSNNDKVDPKYAENSDYTIFQECSYEEAVGHESEVFLLNMDNFVEIENPFGMTYSAGRNSESQVLLESENSAETMNSSNTANCQSINLDHSITNFDYSDLQQKTDNAVYVANKSELMTINMNDMMENNPEEEPASCSAGAGVVENCVNLCASESTINSNNTAINEDLFTSKKRKRQKCSLSNNCRKYFTYARDRRESREDSLITALALATIYSKVKTNADTFRFRRLKKNSKRIKVIRNTFIKEYKLTSQSPSYEEINRAFLIHQKRKQLILINHQGYDYYNKCFNKKTLSCKKLVIAVKWKDGYWYPGTRRSIGLCKVK
jgi:hypothetical protein